MIHPMQGQIHPAWAILRKIIKEIHIKPITGTPFALFISMEVERCAVPVHGGRISPLFDVARRFLVAEIRDGRIQGTSTVGLASASGTAAIETLRSNGVTVVICGAISRMYAVKVIQKNISLIPFVSGSADEVVRAYSKGELKVEQYSMPGCRWRLRFRGGRCPRYEEIFSGSTG